MDDEIAFREVVDRTHATVFRLACALVADRDEAADVTQETYVRAWSRRGELRDPAAALGWLGRIARNVAIDRRRSWWNRIRSPLADDGESAAPAELRAGADEQLIAAQEASTVRRAMRLLSEKHRVVLTLREVEDLSYGEIAELLELPVGTVESRLHRARAALAKRLRAWTDREESR
jgi:RNA polymerase sigma-70 factor (ECF subfamily)